MTETSPIPSRAGTEGFELANDTPTVRPTAEQREEAWECGKIVWIATWRGRKARIVSSRAVPNWIHEGGNEVRWKVIEGKEYLER